MARLPFIYSIIIQIPLTVAPDYTNIGPINNTTLCIQQILIVLKALYDPKNSILNPKPFKRLTFYIKIEFRKKLFYFKKKTKTITQSMSKIEYGKVGHGKLTLTLENLLSPTLLGI